MPLVSIIIPCYNVEEYVSQCLDSVITQTFKNIEIICINDGSTDSTPAILKDYVNKDNRIKVLNQNNSGLSAARNFGVQHSTGDFLMFVDADDWLEKNAIQTLKNQVSVDLICCSYNRIFQSQILPRKLNLKGTFDASFLQRRMVGLLGKELGDPSQIDSLVTAWAKLYKTKILKDNNIQFVDTKIIGTEDALFNITYLEFAETAAVIDLPLYNYRKTNFTSLTNTYNPQLFDKWKILYSKISELRKGKNEDFYIALNNRICLSIIGLGLNETFSTKSPTEKRKKLKEILSDPLYEKAYSNLNLKYFPFHWKLFFYLAKNKWVTPLLWMLDIIKLKISK